MKKAQIGAAIRDFRRRQGLTQTALAQRLGVTQNTVSQYESGRAMPGRAVLLHLLDLEDEGLDEALRDVLDKDDFEDRKQLQAIGDRLSTASAGRVRQVIKSVERFVSEAIADIFLDSPDPRFEIVINYFANRRKDPGFSATLDEMVALIEGDVSGEFISLMRRFQAVASDDEIELIRRHAQAVIRIQEKTQPRSNEKAG